MPNSWTYSGYKDIFFFLMTDLKKKKKNLDKQ